MAEEDSDPFDDGQPEPEAGIHASRRGSGAVELLKDVGQMDCGDADAGIGDKDLVVFAPRPATDQHSALDGITHSVRNDVEQNALQQQRIGPNP
jgi:hypothetical protein